MHAASTPSDSDAVAVERVTKRFGATLALDEASLHVRTEPSTRCWVKMVPANPRS
jgi:hypothetical protein